LIAPAFPVAALAALRVGGFLAGAGRFALLLILLLVLPAAGRLLGPALLVSALRLRGSLLFARFVAGAGLAVVAASRLLLFLLAPTRRILTLGHVTALRPTTRIFRGLRPTRAFALLGTAPLLVLALLRTARRRGLLLTGAALVAILLPAPSIRSVLLTSILLIFGLLAAGGLPCALVLSRPLIGPFLLVAAGAHVLALTVLGRSR
jgi:hypothetical protein